MGLVLLGLILLASAPVWSQDEPRPVPAPAATSGPVEDLPVSEDTSRMLTPPPVSGQSYPTVPTSEERSNYLRGGLAFTTAYTDNAVGPVNGASGERCELFGGPLHRAGRGDVATALGFDLRAWVHLLSARKFPERAGPECVDQLRVPPEPARDVQRTGRLPEKLERI